MAWSREETIGREEMRGIQLGKWQKFVSYVYARNPVYKKKMDAARVTPADIRSLDDVRRLPFTTKAEIRDYYPFGLFTAPQEDIVEFHATSGTTGKMVVIGYTRNDVELWTEVMARACTGAGITKNDIVQNIYGYGLFTGGIGTHYGAIRVGASVIPISGGNTQKQILLMQDFGSTVLTSTPSFLMRLHEVGVEMGVDLKKLKLRIGLLGAEPWSESMRQSIDERFGIKACDMYGLSEMIGPGVSFECHEMRNGLHVNEDYFYPEIIHPETGKAVPDGEEGELVLTTLAKRAMPMIRYRTRDITAFIPEPCGCGRTVRRVRRISRRSDDMFIIRGVNVYPSQVESALLKVEGALPHYQIILTREKGLDNMEVQVEVTPEVFADTVGALEQLQGKINKSLESTLGIRATVRLVQPRTIQRSEGKAKRVIDQRKM